MVMVAELNDNGKTVRDKEAISSPFRWDLGLVFTTMLTNIPFNSPVSFFPRVFFRPIVAGLIGPDSVIVFVPCRNLHLLRVKTSN
jgi:hypothetical protein